MAASVYEFAVLSQLVYKYGYEQDKDQKDEHVGFESDAMNVLTTLGDWSRQYWTADAGSGFVGAIFHKNADLVIACRGSVSVKKDWAGSDLKIALGRPVVNKTNLAIELLEKAKTALPGKTYTVVGHSLGGGIAQLVAGVWGTQAVTFNAPGMKDHSHDLPIKPNAMGRIANFRAELDPVSDLAGPHLGSVYDLATYPQYKMGTAAKLKQKADSHRIAPLVEWIAKQSWKDRSPFDRPHETWTEGKGAVALP